MNSNRVWVPRLCEPREAEAGAIEFQRTMLYNSDLERMISGFLPLHV